MYLRRLPRPRGTVWSVIPDLATPITCYMSRPSPSCVVGTYELLHDSSIRLLCYVPGKCCPRRSQPLTEPPLEHQYTSLAGPTSTSDPSGVPRSTAGGGKNPGQRTTRGVLSVMRRNARPRGTRRVWGASTGEAGEGRRRQGRGRGEGKLRRRRVG